MSYAHSRIAEVYPTEESKHVFTTTVTFHSEAATNKVNYIERGSEPTGTNTNNKL